MLSWLDQAPRGLSTLSDSGVLKAGRGPARIACAFVMPTCREYLSPSATGDYVSFSESFDLDYERARLAKITREYDSPYTAPALTCDDSIIDFRTMTLQNGCF